MRKSWWFVTWLVGCASPTMPPGDDPSGTLIHADTGGVVTFGSDVALVIPPGSLSQDTTIGVALETDIPAADADGFAPAGRAFRFSPPGTQFDLAKPAILTMAYDPTAIASQGLDGRTLELAYYDEALGRYNSIGGVIDPATGKLTAKVEHFTLYIAMAASLVPGDNAPTVALQSPVPNPVRSGAPIYARATIRDYDIGGSIAGADLFVSTNGGPPVKLAMHPEPTLDTFAALVPASQVGATLDYYVVAVDNLGKSTTSGTVHVAPAHSYAPGSLNLAPTTQAIAAGFDKLFAARASDETATVFALVPDSVAATNGPVSANATGVTFSARTVGTGTVSATVGGDTAYAAVTVFDGALASIAILDDHGVPFAGTPIVQEGTRIQLDALGHDAYGNSVLVNPTWANDANAGYVANGLLDTTDGGFAGAVTAQVGDVVGTQWFQVNPRVWATSDTFNSTELVRMTTFAGRPYVVTSEPDAAGEHVEVRHFDGTAWIDDGSPSGTAALRAVAIGGGTTRLEVAWMDDFRVYAAHLEGGSWVRDGGMLNVDPANDQSFGAGHHISIAFDGDTPWIAFDEYENGALVIHARHWTGSQWLLDGGQVNDAGYDGYEPSLAFLGGAPYVAFVEAPFGPAMIYQVIVKRWTGTAWQSLGGSLNLDPSRHGDAPMLAICGGKPTVLFTNYYTSWSYLGLFMQQWDGTAWNIISSVGAAYAINASAYDVVVGHSLACDGATPYALWAERTVTGSSIRRRVAHFNTHTGTWNSNAVWNIGPPTTFMGIAIAGNDVFASTVDNATGIANTFVLQ